MNNLNYFLLNLKENLGNQEIWNKQQLNQIQYSYPVNLEKCQIHRKANLICKRFNEGKKLNVLCECCGRIVGNQPVSRLWYQNKIFAKYGPGIPLYFLFFKYIIALQIAFFLLFGLQGFITNISAHDCQKFKHCWSNGFSMRMSFLNSYEQPSVPIIQLSLMIILLIIQVFAFLYIRYKSKYEKKIFDYFLTSPSDFALILRQLPKGTTQKDIEYTISEYRKFLNPKQIKLTNNLKVHKILFVYDIDEYNQIRNQNLKNFKESCQNKNQFFRIPLPQINKALPTAIIIFEKQQSKGLFVGHLPLIQQIKKSFWLGYQPVSSLVRVKNQLVNVQRAPQPDDIIWQNQGISISDLFTKRITIFLISLNLLLLSAIFQYFLGRLRLNYQIYDQQTQRLFSIASASLITFINFIIQMVLVFSSKFQKPTSHSLLKISMTFKIVLMQFINSGIISILITCMIYLPQFRFHKSAICNDIIYIMIMNVIVNNVFNFCWVYFQIPSLLDRWKLKRNFTIYTQLQANKIFEANVVDLQYKYAYIFKTLWLTAFFMPIQPSVSFLGILALLINYWSEKFLFSGYYTIPQMFSGKISIAVLDLLNYTCLWLTMGSFFIHFLRVNFKIENFPFNYLVFHIAGFIISVFAIFAPLSGMAKNVFGDKKIQQLISQKSYQIEQQNFEITYQSMNPVYRQFQYKNHITRSNKNKNSYLDSLGSKLMTQIFNSPKSQFFNSIHQI